MTRPNAGFARMPDGVDLAYELPGRGHATTPLLLIRPLGGSMARWGSFGTKLAERWPVIGYDARGTGRSGRAPFDVTTRDLAADAARLLDHLGIARAHVFGISLGGMTAQWLALDAPERVGRLVLASTTARGLDLARATLRKRLAFAEALLAPARDVEPRLVLEVLSRRFRRAHPAAVARAEAPIAAEHPRRFDLLKLIAAGARHDTRRRVGDIAAPTLVLAGARDTLLGVEPQRALAASIPGATFELIDGAGHDVTLESAVDAAERVDRFLARPDAARSTL